ncbi:protein draper-like [Ruditapes philippinarum]|uniref:protein draper-like n=1 Tax=Ruditapes philippinarum TaxID=129788 RepID=UPI00295B8F0D|nr:protein draper-like [Ruditapes philippinarum]
MILKYKFITMLSFLVCCKCIFAADGEIDESCKINCACCKNQNCGPDGYFEEGNCYEGCIDGYFGGRCYRKCTYNCQKCEYDADICESCYDGFYLEVTKDCSGVCPSECVSCTSSTFCTKCKEHFYNDHGYRDCRFRKCPVNCKCDQNVCVECQAGYFGPSTTCLDTCPANCYTCLSKDSCQSCKTGYYNGKEFDNPQNPVMNNCVHQCRAECTSCLSFNNCTSCLPGTFGPTCQQKCSTGCNNNVCEKETGNCICRQDFAGTDCTKCILGKFGDLCENNCTAYCKNGICDKKSGECDECISENMIDRKCDTCKEGWYGDTCNLRCPTNCKYNLCERNTGYQTDNINNNNNQTAVIVMGIIIAILMISLAVSLVLLWRARFFQNNTVDKTILPENNMKEAGDKHITSEKNPVYYSVMETGLCTRRFTSLMINLSGLYYTERLLHFDE